MSGSTDVFFSEQIWPCHAGGYWWRVECVHIDAFTGSGGFNEAAVGTAAFKWSARRKIRRRKTQFLREATDSTQQDQPEVAIEQGLEDLKFGPRTYTPEQAEVIAEATANRQPLPADGVAIEGDPGLEKKPQHRAVVRQSGSNFPLGIEPLGTCAARIKDILAEVDKPGSEVEDAWVERRDVTYGPWHRPPTQQQLEQSTTGKDCSGAGGR